MRSRLLVLGFLALSLTCLCVRAYTVPQYSGSIQPTAATSYPVELQGDQPPPSLDSSPQAPGTGPDQSMEMDMPDPDPKSSLKADQMPQGIQQIEPYQEKDFRKGGFQNYLFVYILALADLVTIGYTSFISIKLFPKAYIEYIVTFVAGIFFDYIIYDVPSEDDSVAGYVAWYFHIVSLGNQLLYDVFRVLKYTTYLFYCGTIALNLFERYPFFEPFLQRLPGTKDHAPMRNYILGMLIGIMFSDINMLYLFGSIVTFVIYLAIRFLFAGGAKSK